jgi:hypothetical protein
VAEVAAEGRTLALVGCRDAHWNIRSTQERVMSDSPSTPTRREIASTLDFADLVVIRTALRMLQERADDKGPVLAGKCGHILEVLEGVDRLEVDRG